MELNIIKKIIDILETSNLKKIHLRDGDFEISLEKEHPGKKDVHPEDTHREEKKIKSKEKEKQKVSIEEKDCITSPMVGTFYISPSPDQPPFVKVGDEVNENSIVGIIEAMKVMNEIKAGKKGIIKEILIENAHAVEFGSKLFLIEQL